MASFSFYPRLVQPILKGQKKCTIRKNNHQNLKPGEFVNFISGGKSFCAKQIKKIGVIEIDSDKNIKINGNPIEGKKLQQFSEMEGYDSPGPFLESLINYIGSLPFKGNIFLWD